jgi:hypothetical protein
VAATLAVSRDDLKRARILASAPVTPDGSGPRAVLRVEGFALTTNNLFYTSYGDPLSSFWSFFPLADPGWGCVPAWGYATVVTSDVEGVAVGARYFGYVPMASEVTVQPANIGATSFLDSAGNRPAAIPIYNTYNASAADPLYSPELEPAMMLFRPLFTTSFLLADFLVENAFFGAEQVVLSSASSKTAYGTAYALSKSRGTRIVGLTSEKNRSFVDGLGIYDQVVTYADVGSIVRTRTAYVDVAGAPALRSSLRHVLRNALTYDCPVGGTHWQSRADTSGQPLADDGTGAASPMRFLAATQIAKRVKDWGRAGFQQNVAAALSDFVSRITAAERPWVRFVTARGPDEVLRAYDEVISGRAAPENGYVLSL